MTTAEVLLRLLVHHRGIIHRDIKPANLLWTKDRTTVKIVDFGVAYLNSSVHHTLSSKHSKSLCDESLFDESDLLKRTGTPSFLAPEVVWFSDQAPQHSPTTSGDTLATGSNQTTIKNRTSFIPSLRPPITKAIDIWSLAVTFYCLLFGHTPFSVPESGNENIYHNEFVLYNQICTQDWEVDETMGAEQTYTGGRHPKDPKGEGCAIVNLLDHMLRKDPTNRITISELKVCH